MAQTPLDTLFDLQQTALRQTGAVTEELVRLPGEFAFTGLDPGRGAVEGALELSRQSTHRSLDAAESALGGDVDQLRATTDEVYDQLQAQHDQLFGAAADEQIDGLDEAVDTQVQTLLDGPLTAGEFPAEFEAVLEQFEFQLGLSPEPETEPTTIEIDDVSTETP